MTPTAYLLHVHTHPTPWIVNYAEDGRSAQIAHPIYRGQTTVSGPNRHATTLRVVDAVLQTFPGAAFTLQPSTDPGPAQWRKVYEAAAAVLAVPGEDARGSALSDLAATLKRLPADVLSDAVPSVGAVVRDLDQTTSELLDAALELAAAIQSEKVWGGALSYAKALLNFDVKTAERVKDSANGKALELAGRVVAAAAVLRPAKSGGRRK